MAIATYPPAANAPRSAYAMAADLLDETSEFAQHEAERESIAQDVRKLLPYVWILHPTDGPVRFAPWAWQLGMFLLWMTERLVVVLKARQLGVSWLAAIYALWSAMFKRGQKVLIISKGQKDSDAFLEKVKFVFKRLPDWMKPNHTENASELVFPDLDSSITALPATENVGRSLTASLVILDEHGHQPWARKIYLAIKAAVEKGQVLSISTGNGLGALHSQIFAAAKDNKPLRVVRMPNGTELRLLAGGKVGRNGYRAVFVPASAHPDRQDPAWRERERASYEGLTAAMFEQEYPENDRDAFVITGRPVFSEPDIRRQVVGEQLRDEKGHEYEPGLFVYSRPEKDKVYVIGADVGEGLERSDFSSASVFERDTMDQVAQLRGRWTPDIYAARLDRLARYYGQHSKGPWDITAILAVERNNHGHAVLQKIVELHAETAPYSIYRAKDKRRGWHTTPGTRPVLIDQLEAALRNGELHLHDGTTIDQLGTFHWNDDGKPEAQEGYFDDDVMATGIALQVRRTSFGRQLHVTATAA